MFFCKIREFILYLRNFKSYDQYLITGIEQSSVKAYINHKFNELLPIINTFIESLSFMNDIGMKLTPSDEASILNIKGYLKEDHRFSTMGESEKNEFALQINNYMKTSCQYLPEIQTRIDTFLS